MAALLLLPNVHLFVLISLSLALTIVFLIQLAAGCCNLAMKYYCPATKQKQHQQIFNVYLFHHLIVCMLRCLTIFMACCSIILFDRCLPIEYPIHFLLLLSSFDLLFILIGETVHFWDSTVNHKSTLHSRCCLVFGILFNYFVSSLFLAIHMTMSREITLLVEMCQLTKRPYFLMSRNVGDKNLIPTIIIFVLFILLNCLTLLWTYISHRDIFNLKQKRLVTLFFQSLVFTKFKEHERLAMVNRSLKRLRTIYLLVLSNMIVILPVLAIKIFGVSLNRSQRTVFIYMTSLPWLDSMMFFFYNETKFNAGHCCSTTPTVDAEYQRQQRIGRRLSSYRENRIAI